MSEKEAVTEKAPEAAKQNCVSQKQQPEFSLTAGSPVGRILFMQRTIGNQAVGRFVKSGALQGKFRIGKADDIYEKEADIAAKQVMSDINMPDGLSTQVHKDLAGPPALKRSCNCGGKSGLDENPEVHRLPALSLSTIEDSVVARVIDPNDLADSQPVEEIFGAVEKTDEKMAQRKAADGAFPQATTPDLSQSIDGACRSGGQPLPSESQEFMERRFGHNFGAVRIHADQIAGDLAHQVQARAFTTGNHVFFAPGEFQPDRTSGKYLLAHELAHVVQQGKGSGGVDRKIQRTGNGGLNCPPYASYDGSRDLSTYNCAGLAHRTYDFKSLANTKTALSKGSSVASGTPCDHVGVVKHWLWEYDIRMEDSDGKVVAPTWQDFHTVGGPTDGDPLAKDSDEYYTKNGKRKVYGPGTAPSFKPVARDQALKNEPAETPMVDDKGRPLYKVRSNIKETCYCLPCPK